MKNAKLTYDELENRVKELESKWEDIAKKEIPESRVLYEKFIRYGDLHYQVFEKMREFVIVV